MLDDCAAKVTVASKLYWALPLTLPQLPEPPPEPLLDVAPPLLAFGWVELDSSTSFAPCSSRSRTSVTATADWLGAQPSTTSDGFDDDDPAEVEAGGVEPPD